MKVLVTGGAGFVGRHLVRALVEAGDDVTVLDNLHRSSRTSVHSSSRFLEGDIRDRAALDRAARGAEMIYHMAAQSNVLGSTQDVDYSFTTNVVGTFELLKAAERAGVRRVVFTSSREVYGEQRILPVSETAQTSAKNAYGASKVAGEAYCRAWAARGELDCAIVRLSNVYGPGDSGRVIPTWLARAADGQDLIVFGGQQVIDFIPVETAVAAIRQAALVDLDAPVNVGSGRGTPLLALAERIGALAGGRVATVVEPARDAEVVRYVADTTRMRGVLGIEPPADPLCLLPDLWGTIAARRPAA
ncbi:MAG: NAD-dependent epimerase/dehydratase family protein [Dehalococcoidia bacterium]